MRKKLVLSIITVIFTLSLCSLITASELPNEFELTDKQVSELIDLAVATDIDDNFVDFYQYKMLISEIKDNYQIISLSNDDSYQLGLINVDTKELVIPFEYDQMYFLPNDKVIATENLDFNSNDLDYLDYYEIDYNLNKTLTPIKNRITFVDDMGYISVAKLVDDENLKSFLNTIPTQIRGGANWRASALFDSDYNEILGYIFLGETFPTYFFIDDFAVITIYDEPSNLLKNVIIDREGNFLIEPTTYALSNYGYGKFEVFNGYDKGHFIDANGNRLSDKLNVRQNLPSDWAKEDIENAYKVGLLNVGSPEYGNKSGYFNWNCTREQFCELAINLYSITKGKENLPKLDETSPFTDTNSKHVQMAYKLGIVTGKSEGKFDPFADLTRQEAATMLDRLAKIIEVAPNSEALEFNDYNLVSDYAKDAVISVSSMEDSTENRLMGGIGDNKFAPNSPYTSEQAIVTMYRLYDIYNERGNITK